jgi:tRNA (cytidine32/uridine32-2'-O)-methyltransferase
VPEPSVYVVLVRPREEGNVGSTARAMANMGLERLALVEPAPALGDQARALGIGAGHVLDRTERHPSLAAALRGARRVVGTTSSRDRTLPLAPISPRALARLHREDPVAGPTALVFGPEVGGLSNDDLAHCGVLVTIPTAPSHPTLNLSQSVLVLAYELFVGGARGASEPGGRTPAAPATAESLGGLIAQWRALLGAAGFARDRSFEGVARDLGAWLVRAAPGEREVRILRGVARRLSHRLANQLRHRERR